MHSSPQAWRSSGPGSEDMLTGVRRETDGGAAGGVRTQTEEGPRVTHGAEDSRGPAAPSPPLPPPPPPPPSSDLQQTPPTHTHDNRLLGLLFVFHLFASPPPPEH